MPGSRGVLHHGVAGENHSERRRALPRSDLLEIGWAQLFSLSTRRSDTLRSRTILTMVGGDP